MALLTEEIEFLKANGNEIMILGDMNAHFKHLDTVPENGNTVRIQSLMEETGLSRANDSPKCKGRYTWQRNKSRSVVDYVLVDETVESMIDQILIDDVGDHSCYDPLIRASLKTQ